MAYAQNDINSLIAILQAGRLNAQTAFQIERANNLEANIQ